MKIVQYYGGNQNWQEEGRGKSLGYFLARREKEIRLPVEKDAAAAAVLTTLVGLQLASQGRKEEEEEEEEEEEVEEEEEKEEGKDHSQFDKVFAANKQGAVACSIFSNCIFNRVLHNTVKQDARGLFATTLVFYSFF